MHNVPTLLALTYIEVVNPIIIAHLRFLFFIRLLAAERFPLPIFLRPFLGLFFLGCGISLRYRFTD
jgi:hypothetical protein